MVKHSVEALCDNCEELSSGGSMRAVDMCSKTGGGVDASPDALTSGRAHEDGRE